MLFTVAIIVAVGVTALMFWLRGKGVKFSWYEALIAVIGVALLLFGLQNYYGFTAEFEPQAATQALFVMGLPALLFLAVAGALIWRRNKTAA